MVSFSADQYILLISFFIIFGAFFAYDLFKRGEKYGYFAYVAALIPANYLWYIATKGELWLDFGAMGGMMILAVLWVMCVIRDILIKNKKDGFKDADDIALMLIISLVIQFILTAVLPAIPGNADMQKGTYLFWNYFYLPDYGRGTANPPLESIVMAYRLVATILTVSIIIPIVIDLRGAKVSLIAVVIITAVFALPFAFLAFLWLPGAIGPLLFLICVLFFLILLGLTRGTGN
jgi:hypothetical protein